MSCNQTLTGIASDCTPSMGGIRRVLLANRADVTSRTVVDGIVTAITMASSGSSTAKFHAYAFKPETAYVNNERQINAANGGNYVNTAIYMQFHRQDTTKRLEVEAIAHAETVAIYEDNNGLFWMAGYDNPLTESAGNAPTGTAAGDFNGYTTTISGNEPEYPLEVDADIIEGLL